MSKFITINSKESITRLAFIKAKLESEGIECFIIDEFTNQVLDLYANAIGGVRLQIKKSDFEKAYPILVDNNIIDPKDTEPLPIWRKAEEFTSNIPLLNRLKLEFRLITLTALLSTIIFIPIGLYIMPTTYEKLIDNTWCVDYISFNNEKYLPKSLGLKLVGFGFCNEQIYFSSQDEVDFPGFNTNPIKANWLFRSDTLFILKADTFKHVYEQSFAINFMGRKMTLNGENTIIHCSQNRY